MTAPQVEVLINGARLEPQIVTVTHLASGEVEVIARGLAVRDALARPSPADAKVMLEAGREIEHLRAALKELDGLACLTTTGSSYDDLPEPVPLDGQTVAEICRAALAWQP